MTMVNSCLKGLSEYYAKYYCNFILFKITQTQITQFGEEVKIFQERFKDEGPGSVGKDLDRGRQSFKYFFCKLFNLCLLENWLAVSISVYNNNNNNSEHFGI